MGMCAIGHNENTRDESGRFYKIFIYNIAFLSVYSFYTIISNTRSVNGNGQG